MISDSLKKIASNKALIARLANQLRADEGRLMPPYGSFGVAWALIDVFRVRGLPSRIDKFTFSGASSAHARQFVIAFRFLGLIDENGKPQRILRTLIARPAKDERQALLRQILESAYPGLFELDLALASHSDIDEAIARYDISAATRQKAKSFFLQAAIFAGVKLSRELMRKKPKGQSASQRSAGESKTIVLRSGAKVHLLLSEKILDLQGDDRTFVLSLIDQLRGYETEVRRTQE